MKYEHKDGKDFDFLIGKSIIKVVKKKQLKDDGVDQYVLTCKDGTIIEIETNGGCGGCANGWSSFEDGTIIEIETNGGCGGCVNGWSSFEDLKKLEENNNIITNIEVKYTEDGWDDEFTMFIYYEDNTINRLKGDDGYGNGYYGGGFYVTIKNLDKENQDVKN